MNVAEQVSIIESKFLNQFSGETDPSKLLIMEGIEDDPKRLSKEMANHPAQYAYWASMRKKAEDRVNDIEEKIEMWEASKYQPVCESLMKKGLKTPTQKAVDAEMALMYQKDEWSIKAKAALKEAKNALDKITVIERAISERGQSLRMIGSLIERMMQTGLYVSKSSEKGKI